MDFREAGMRQIDWVKKRKAERKLAMKQLQHLKLISIISRGLGGGRTR